MSGTPHSVYFTFSVHAIRSEAFDCGIYKVMHYDRRALGNAFGPLSLIQLTCFCEELSGALSRHSQVLVEHFDGVPTRANTAVLLGGYLIIKEGWKVHNIADAMPEVADTTFPCQWDRPSKHQHRVMTVRDCWAGIELAKKLGWLRSFAGDALGVSLAVSQQRRTVAEYDAAWLIPDKIMVMADPMTTIRDPNPNTCMEFSKSKHQAFGEVDVYDDWKQPSPVCSPRQVTAYAWDGNGRQITKDTCDTSDAGSASSAPEGAGLALPCVAAQSRTPAEHIENASPRNLWTRAAQLSNSSEEGDDRDSVASVCKRDHLDFEALLSGSTRACTEIPDFMTFCTSNQIAVIVRTNSGEEEGLVEDGGSYHAALVRRHNIQHVDMFVNDTRGSLPSLEVVKQFLDLAGKVGLIKESVEGIPENSPGMLVHCKSGFGRSVLLACCLIIYAYDVPGRPLLGWVRMARPGAITVQEQEMFLCDLNGRADLQKLLEDVRSSHDAGGLLACQPCCAVQ